MHMFFTPRCRSSLITLALVAASASLAHAAEVTPARPSAALTQLDALAPTVLKKSGVPGVAILVVYNDKVVHLKGFGVREAGQPDAIGPNTVFQLALISNSGHDVLLAARSDNSQPGALLPEYSVYSQNEATVRYVHSAILQAMADSGYQPGWKQMVDGRGIETWYHWGLDQTIMSVCWSTETGYVQSTFRQPGRLKAGEAQGPDASGVVLP